MKNSEFYQQFIKKIHGTKLHVDINGNAHNVQGYESYAIDYFLKNGISLTSKYDQIGNIDYVIDDNSKKYYPDLLLEDGTYIEVKSLYTLSRSIEKMISVYESNKDKNIKIYVFDPKESEPVLVINNLDELLDYKNNLYK